jgi:hypothetical protein
MGPAGPDIPFRDAAIAATATPNIDLACTPSSFRPSPSTARANGVRRWNGPFS